MIAPAPPMPGAQRTAVSSQQLGLWFIHQADPSCGAYNLVFTAEVVDDGGLSGRAGAILADLGAEYAALRVCFTSGEDGPVQWVVPLIEPDVCVTDARGMEPDVLRHLVRADSRAPFNLARPPLWRIQLYRLGKQNWVVAVVAHHIAVDFWSLGLLLAEARDRLTGSASSVTIDGSAFAEYAEHQQAQLSHPDVTSEWRSAWTRRLAGAPARIDLPTDRPHPTTPSHDGGSVPFALSAQTSEQIRLIAQETSGTPYIALLTAYHLLLARVTGHSDVVVGTPTSGRLDRRFRYALGSFVNTVVVRGEVDEATTYRDLLRANRDRVQDALRGQRTPFPWLVGALAPPRDSSHTPIYQVGFAWDRLPFLAELGDFFLLEPGDTELELGGARLRPYPIPQQEGQLDLWVEMGGERDGGYVGVLRYNTDIFDAGTARELAAGFVTTIESVLARPDQTLNTLPTVDAEQAHRLRLWGRGPDRELPGSTLTGLVLAQARQTPSAPAVSDVLEDWDYRTLTSVAADISSLLRARGVGRGDRVGVMIERGRPLVAALLGVLALGAVYVPLDPDFPADRLDYMASDSAAKVVLSQEALRSGWPSGVPVCLIDHLPPSYRELPDDGEPQDVAYVLYTSGSTGRPKGVAVSHRALVNLLLAMREETGFSAIDTMLAVTTISFDIAGLELFLPLVAGGRVIVCEGATTRDGHALATRIEQTGATWMQATPTTWRMLRDSGWHGNSWLQVLCGGEELPLDLAAFLAPRVAGLRNVYGPTETTIWSTAGPVRPVEGIDLGTPLANTQLYLTDPYGRLVAPGTFGELHIGGVGLAEGYWGRPDLTAERFLTGLPCAPGVRLYRTGDRARWTSTGRLQHHGRLDSQVKLRGYRIELAEVETVLRAMPQVRAGVVVVRGDRLVAYLVPAEGVELTTVAVKSAAAATLPPYMVPSTVIILAELPMTANNKIDRNALPAPEAVSTAAFEEPRDATEITLARLWSELLDVPRVGIHDDFFELGGHSLLAVRLSTMIRTEWGHDLRISDLLRHSTIAELAALVRKEKFDDARSPLVTLRQGEPDQRPLFLFHPFGGTVFCYVELTRQLPPGRPVVAIEAPGLEHEGEAEVTVEAMASRYLAELRSIQPQGPYALGGWCFGGVIAYEAARQLRAGGELVDTVVAIDSRAPVQENVPESADDSTLLSWFARDLATPFGQTLQISPDELRGLHPDDAFDHVLARASQIGVLAADADRAQLLRYFEAYLANGIALQSYAPPASQLDLLLLKADDEPADYGPTLGWSALIEGALRVVPVPGDHNSVMYAPHAGVAAAVIAEQLSSAASVAPPVPAPVSLNLLSSDLLLERATQ